jgi:hypothetical protein
MLAYLNNINQEYLAIHGKEAIDNKTENLKPNIMIALMEIGTAINYDSNIITIYHKEDYQNNIKMLIDEINDDIYLTKKDIFQANIENNKLFILDNCVRAINNDSAIELEKYLKEYMYIYEITVSVSKDTIGDYSYDGVYKMTHSFVKFKGYKIFEWIKRDLFDYASMKNVTNNFKLMNQIISFLYGMILYSYSKKDLISIQYLYDTYSFMNSQSAKLEKNYSLEKIKLEIFEFINLIRYELENSNDVEFNKDALMICNKTVVNITKQLFTENKKMYNIYNAKLYEFVKRIGEKIEELRFGEDKKTIELRNTLEEVLKHFESNIFAMHSYILNDIKEDSEQKEKLLTYYKKYSSVDISKIYLNATWIDFNDHTYDWDMWEEHEFDSGAWNVNTSIYLTQLYCICLNEIPVSRIELPVNSDLTDKYNSGIKNELLHYSNNGLIEKFEELVKRVEDQEKEYLRNNPISENKVIQFKNKFFEEYEKNAELHNVMNKYSNFELVDEDSETQNNLGLNSLVDKTYFLEKMPNNRCIVWLDFEENFAKSFINSEEKRYTDFLRNNSKKVEGSLSEFLNKRYKNKLDKIIIFANYKFGYYIPEIDKVKYSIKILNIQKNTS